MDPPSQPWMSEGAVPSRARKTKKEKREPGSELGADRDAIKREVKKKARALSEEGSASPRGGGGEGKRSCWTSGQRSSRGSLLAGQVPVHFSHLAHLVDGGPAVLLIQPLELLLDLHAAGGLKSWLTLGRRRRRCCYRCCSDARASPSRCPERRCCRRLRGSCCLVASDSASPSFSLPSSPHGNYASSL